MKIQNGSEYESNFARAAASFLGTCAPAPADGDRLAAYRLITGLYVAIACDPEALGWKPLPDVSFAPWEPQKGREKDIKAIRGAIDKIDALMANLFAVAEAAEPSASDPACALLPADFKPGRALEKALALVGFTVEKRLDALCLTGPAGCFSALRELAAISRAHTIPITDGPKEDKPYLYFSRCVFDPDTDWTAQAFDRLLGADGRLIRLCAELEARGYRRVDCFDGKKISLDYVKLHGKKDEPLKIAWGERVHSGISLTFEELRLAPAFFWLRLPMFRTVLACADKLPDGVSSFLERCTKTCDGCRYCVQTDKTHTRPLAFVKVNGKNKCPHFPGFTMNWRTLTPELAEHTLALLDALDALAELK